MIYIGLYISEGIIFLGHGNDYICQTIIKKKEKENQKGREKKRTYVSLFWRDSP